MFYFIKSETSDSFVNHFNGHFAYLKTLDFYFKKWSRDCLLSNQCFAPEITEPAPQRGSEWPWSNEHTSFTVTVSPKNSAHGFPFPSFCIVRSAKPTLTLKTIPAKWFKSVKQPPPLERLRKRVHQQTKPSTTCVARLFIIFLHSTCSVSTHFLFYGCLTLLISL